MPVEVTVGTTEIEVTASGSGHSVVITTPSFSVSQGGGGVSDHGALTGLADDDHLQYHTDARGDALYSLLGHDHDLDYADIVHTHLQTDITNLDAFKPDGLMASQFLGGALKAQAGFVEYHNTNGATTLSDGQIKFLPVIIRNSMTLTGAMWGHFTQGNYTADNNNKIGLYSYSGGTLTKVAETANDGNLWKQATNTNGTRNFTTPYLAAPGLYFVAILWNSSGTTTAPTILFGISSFNQTSTMDFTNSAKLFSTIAAQTDLSSTYAMSALTTAGIHAWVGLY